MSVAKLTAAERHYFRTYEVAPPSLVHPRIAAMPHDTVAQPMSKTPSMPTIHEDRISELNLPLPVRKGG